MSTEESLKQLEELLVKFVPEAVKNARIDAPVYSLMVEYFGTDCFPPTPSLLLPTEGLRKSIVDSRGVEAPHYLWYVGELDAIDGVLRVLLDSYAPISDVANRWAVELDKNLGN